MGGKVIEAISQCAMNEIDSFEFESESDFELNDESTDDDVVTFDLIDTIKKVMEKLREKVNCSLNAVGSIIAEGELRNVYERFRSDVENTLKNGVKKCLEADGAIGKLKYVFCIYTICIDDVGIRNFQVHFDCYAKTQYNLRQFCKRTAESKMSFAKSIHKLFFKSIISNIYSF